MILMAKNLKITLHLSLIHILTVVSADVENGILAIKGAIPGPKGGIVLVRSAVKGA